MPTDKTRSLPRWDLYVITDEGLSGGRSHEEQARAALAGGAGVIQLRDKTSSSLRLYEAALAIRKLCRDHGALLIVNDRVDIALAANADGVHIGPDDLPVEVVRQLMPGRLVGASAGTVEEAVQMERDGADYLGVGAIYEARGSKADAGPPVGPARLAAIRAAVRLPLVGIGGIKAGNAAPVIAAGADGVAVITGVVGAPDITAAARELVKIVEVARQGRTDQR